MPHHPPPPFPSPFSRAFQIIRASKMVALYTGIPVQPNKAIVGANAFAHEAGIHQHGVLKHAATCARLAPPRTHPPTHLPTHPSTYTPAHPLAHPPKHLPTRPHLS